jgi:hypothetical protein
VNDRAVSKGCEDGSERIVHTQARRFMKSNEYGKERATHQRQKRAIAKATKGVEGEVRREEEQRQRRQQKTECEAILSGRHRRAKASAVSALETARASGQWKTAESR